MSHQRVLQCLGVFNENAFPPDGKACILGQECNAITQDQFSEILGLLPLDLCEVAAALIKERHAFIEREGRYPPAFSDLSERTIDFHCDPGFVAAREAVLGQDADAKFPPLLLGPEEKDAFYTRYPHLKGGYDPLKGPVENWREGDADTGVDKPSPE